MNKPRVLVVDDEPQILRFLRPGLTAGDFDVITAATGAEAVKSAATMAPDVIVLDLGLPDKDGKDVIREIRAWSKVPIIVLSARDRESEKIESLDLGADDYVNKPFGIGELMARIRASLRNRQQTEVVTRVFRVGGSSLIRSSTRLKGMANPFISRQKNLICCFSWSRTRTVC